MTKYLTVPQFAEMVGAKRVTVYKWIDWGFVAAKDFATKGRKIRSLRIPASEVARVRANKKAGIPIGCDAPASEVCVAMA